LGDPIGFDISFGGFDMGAIKRLAHGVLVTVLLTGCGGSTATAPGNSPPDGGPAGGGSGGGGGGAAGGPTPSSVTVTLGNNFFRSDRNRSANPAVDSVVAGGKVTWKWVNTGSVPHNVQSVGTPSFRSSDIESVNGSTYELTFTTPGSYRYNCAIHGDMMTGVVVVTAQ
jgi:plastocyanin